jgi:hypothetical protein
VLGRVDIAAPVWVVGRVRETDGIDAALGLDPGSLREVALSLRFDAGVTVFAQLEFADPAAADSTAMTLRSYVALLGSSMGPELEAIAKRASIDTIDTAVLLRASATAGELRSLVP